MMRRRKLEIKSLILSVVIFALLMISSVGYSNTINDGVSEDLFTCETPVGIPGEKAIKADARLYTLQSDDL